MALKVRAPWPSGVSSVMPVTGKSLRRSGWTLQVNSCFAAGVNSRVSSFMTAGPSLRIKDPPDFM